MRDKEFIDLSNAYNQICEQSYGIDASKHGGPDKLLQKMVDEKKRRGDKDGGGEVVQSGLQKANYEPEGELVLERDETEEGITGLPIPKKKMSPAKRHKFEQKRREERKKRGDERVGDTFSQHRMTGSRGHGSEYENIRSVREEILVDYLLGEGFAFDEKSAQAIANVMGEEWKQSILEMDDFAAGGGNAKMKQTGMSKDQVIALGKKNLANAPKKQPTSQSQGSSSQTSSPKVAYGQLISKPGQPKRYADSGTVTARHKFHTYNDSTSRAQDVASWMGVSHNDPRVKKWADTNYRQNIAMDTNDPNYDPTKTSYPTFAPPKRSAR